MENNDKKYVVAICGYEGIDSLFGPFSQEEALKVALYYKTEIQTRERPLWQANDEEHDDYYKWIELKFDMFNYFKPEQVCIMGSVNDQKRMECRCQECGLPELKESWLY